MRWPLLVVAVAFSCERGHGSAPVAIDAAASDAAPDARGARDPGVEDGEPPDGGTSDTERTLDATPVQAAYRAVAAGDFDEAARRFGALGLPVSAVTAIDLVGRPRGPAPQSALAQAAAFGSLTRRNLYLPPGARHGVLTTPRRCDFGPMSKDRCFRMEGQTDLMNCFAGRLTAPCATLAVDVDDGRVAAAYDGWDAVGRGPYLVTYGPDARAHVRSLDDLGELVAAGGTILGKVDGAKLLSQTIVRLDHAGPPSARIDVRLVDPIERRVSGPCPAITVASGSGPAFADLSWQTPAARLVAGGTRILVDTVDDIEMHQLVLCTLDGTLLLRTSAEGDTTSLVDRDDKRLFISGILAEWPGPRGSMPLDFTALRDHWAVDPASGAVVGRARTRESRPDMPGRAMAISDDGGTLAVGSDHDVTSSRRARSTSWRGSSSARYRPGTPRRT
jgi:hypothetical protein